MMMLAHIAVPGTKLVQLAPGLAFRPNFPLIMYVGYQLYYLYLEPIGGVSSSSFCFRLPRSVLVD